MIERILVAVFILGPQLTKARVKSLFTAVVKMLFKVPWIGCTVGVSWAKGMLEIEHGSNGLWSVCAQSGHMPGLKRRHYIFSIQLPKIDKCIKISMFFDSSKKLVQRYIVKTIQ